MADHPKRITAEQIDDLADAVRDGIYADDRMTSKQLDAALAGLRRLCEVIESGRTAEAEAFRRGAARATAACAAIVNATVQTAAVSEVRAGQSGDERSGAIWYRARVTLEDVLARVKALPIPTDEGSE